MKNFGTPTSTSSASATILATSPSPESFATDAVNANLGVLLPQAKYEIARALPDSAQSLQVEVTERPLLPAA